MNKNIYYSIIFFCAVAFFFMNHAIPFMADDAAYARYFPEKAIQGAINGTELYHPIHSVREIVESLYHHYFILNGRSFLHIPVQFICGLWHDKLIYDLFAAFIIGLQIILLSRICNEKGKNLWIGFAVEALFWSFYVEPNSMLMGVAYGMNYVYAPTLSLLFIYLFLRKELNNTLYNIILCAIAFPVGWSHEGFTVPIGAALLFYLYKYWRTVTKFQLIAFCFFAIGALFLILAPGNYRKAEIFSGILRESRMNVIYFTRLSYILLGFCFYLFWKQRERFIAFIKDQAFWFVAWIVGICFIIYIGALNERAVFAYELFSTIILVKLADYFWNAKTSWEIVSRCSAFFLLCGFSVLAYCQSTISKQFESCESQLASIVESGNVMVVVPDAFEPKCFDSYLCSPLRHHYERIWQEEWQWTVYAWQYNKESVTILSESQAPLFSPEYKVPGKNPFYRRGRYIYTKEALPSNIQCTLQLGDYNILNMKGAVKKIASCIKHPSSNEVSSELTIEELLLGKEKIYRIYLPDEAVRFIKGMDCYEK